MTKWLLPVLLVLALANPMVGLANPMNAYKDQESADSHLLLPVPSSELKLRERLDDVASADSSAIEIGISSWVPSEFTRPTYSSGPQEFGPGAYPFISLSRVAPLIIGASGSGLYSKLGVASVQLERNLQRSRIGRTYTVSQTLTVLSLRIGVELSGPRFFSEWLQPFAGLSLLPTTAFSSQSQLEARVSAQGLPMEASAGVSAYPKFFPRGPSGARNNSVGLGLHYVFGNLDKSNLDGLGVQGFFRLDL